jgi:hypothetical protein
MTPEEITTAFAKAAEIFTPIVGQPNDDDLTRLREVLYPLLLDIPYDDEPAIEGVYRHNLIGLIEPTIAYTATWHEPFPKPAQPAAYPAIADDATPVVRARSEANHARIIRDYKSYDAAERAVAKFIREAVDEVWYKDLKDVRSFYTNVTAKELMDHLDANCGGLHSSEVVHLQTEMMTFYAKADGIPEYIDMLEEAQRKSIRAKLPISDEQLLAIASTAVLGSGHFPRPTDEWEALPNANKTWTQWKHHYRAAHIARKRQMLAAGAPAFGAANTVTADNTTITPDTFAQLDGYLNNLAAAASTEQTTLTKLVENNASLTASVAALTASVTALTAAYTILSAKGTAPKANYANSGDPTDKKRTKWTGKLDPNGYCWTHGYRVRLGHTSVTCTDKKSGHQDAATRGNTMGGSTNNKPDT